MDFEKIRLEVVEDFNKKLVNTDSSVDEICCTLIELSSKIAKEMLIKYHEELNSK